jgi:hypothetical protein
MTTPDKVGLLFSVIICNCWALICYVMADLKSIYKRGSSLFKGNRCKRQVNIVYSRGSGHMMFKEWLTAPSAV